jgi:carbamoyltransferase
LNILGINAFNCDSAAALLADGQLVGAVEEERFRRIKHWAGFPTESIRHLLDRAGLKPGDIDHVAIGRKPTAHLPRKILFALRRRPSLAEIGNRLSNTARVTSLKRIMADSLEVDATAITARIHAVEHHRAHMASSYFLSPFDTAACLTVDGSGDFVTTMFGAGQGRELTIDGWVEFPHSLGLFYTAVTQYLGFDDFGEEYKVMGLAPYGEPEFLDAFRGIVSTREGGQFRLDLDWFRHHKEGIRTQWEGDAPSFGRVYSDAWVRNFGPARAKDAPLEDRH